MICYYFLLIGGVAGALYAFFALAKIVIGLIKNGQKPESSAKMGKEIIKVVTKARYRWWIEARKEGRLCRICGV